MQQDPFFYHTYPHQDPRLQYPNAGSFPAQANASTWPNTFVPEVNLNQHNVPNPYNYGTGTVSTAMYSSTATFSWAHTVPSLMPWVTQGSDNPSVPDPVMRFSAPFPPDPCTSQTATSWELLNNLNAKTNVNMHLKRKNELDALEAAAPHKMCITEERMSARLKELHISNQYSVPTESSPFGPYNSSSSSTDSMADKSVTNLQQLEAMIKGTQSEGTAKSLVLAPELKKLVEPEKIFSTFLQKIERPSMAVVLWQPQANLLPSVNNNSKTKEEDKESALSLQLNAIRSLNSSAVAAPSSEDVMDT